MSGLAIPYLIAIGAFCFSALSGLTLISFANHLDPSEIPSSGEPMRQKVA